MRLEIGSRVAHLVRGEGTVVGYNPMQSNGYFKERPEEAAFMAKKIGALGAVAMSFYSGERYPYIVKFNTGYQDVYAEEELKEI